MDNPQLVWINLQQLEWTNFIEVTGGGGSDGTPTASPYLWTIFFKADGQTLQIGADGTLAGAATVVFTPGSHGNLGTRLVQIGQPIPIPSSIGQWSTVLQPIPVAPALQGLIGKEFPATVGFVAVLMNEDHGAGAGNQALNAEVQNALASVLAKLGPGHTMVTAQDIAGATATIPGQVHDAIENAQSFWENLWSVSGPDQEIDFKVVTWSQPQLPNQTGPQQFAPPLQFGPDWNAWQLEGTINAIDLCAAISVRIGATRRGAADCSKNIVVQGEQCVFSAQVAAPSALVSDAFNFSWSVVNGGTIVSGQTNQRAVVSVDSGASQITVSVTATDNYGCSVKQSKTFPVISQDMAGLIDRICALREKLLAVRVPIPTVLLHPAGPNPAPDRALVELNRLAERLAAETQLLINSIRRGRG